MMWLKGCPKCRGDLFEEPTIGLHAAARSISCLQCGHTLTEREEASLTLKKSPAGAARARVGPTGAPGRVA